MLSFDFATRLASDLQGITDAGPVDAEEVQEWCTHIVNQCRTEGMRPTWFEGKVVWVSSLWAGLGGMPIGTNFLAETISQIDAIPDLNIKHWSFSEYDATCQGNR